MFCSSQIHNSMFQQSHTHKKMSSAKTTNRREFSNPRSFTANSPLLKIMVVDDDSTSLAIISAMLREFRYEVTSVKNPMAALSVLRANPGNIDLVLTDLHMPEMNGIELQRQIKREFKLPVIIISSDDSESVMLESLSEGAVFFIVKPVQPDGLKNVWQYAVAAKKGKSMVIKEIKEDSSSATTTAVGKVSISNMRCLSSSANGERVSKRNAQGKDKDGRDEDNNPKHKKARKTKVVWTNTLHNQFLDALRHIGLEKAVPKTILEHMNVRGLTRENVASHLQKYRIFLKRVAERSCFSSKAMFDRFVKSTFAEGHHPLLVKTAQEYARMQDLQRLRSLTSYPDYGGSYSPHMLAMNTKPVFSGNLMNPPNLEILMGYGNGSNLSLNSGFSSGLMSGANSWPSYPQQIQAGPGFYDACSSSQLRFGSLGLHSSSSNGHTNLNPGYAGISLKSDGLTGGYGPMNCVFNKNMNVETMGNQAFDYQVPGGFTNQVPPTFTASNQQENTSMALALNNPGVADYNPDQQLNNGFDLHLGDENYLNELSDLILGSNKYQLSNQQQGGDGGFNDPEYSFSSLFPEIYSSLDELRNFNIDESQEDKAPRNERDLGQVQSSFEELINPNAAAVEENSSNDQSSLLQDSEEDNFLASLFNLDDLLLQNI